MQQPLWIMSIKHLIPEISLKIIMKNIALWNCKSASKIFFFAINIIIINIIIGPQLGQKTWKLKTASKYLIILVQYRFYNCTTLHYFSIAYFAHYSCVTKFDPVQIIQRDIVLVSHSHWPCSYLPINCINKVDN